MDDYYSCCLQKKLFIIVFAFILMSACENDLSEVNQIAFKDNSPFETSRNIELIYSEKGQIQLKVVAPLLERYLTEEPYLEMTEGIEVIFYDSLLNVTSRLTSKYAISYENEKITEARNNVVVVNDKNERLDTEHLIWDEKRGIIYSDVFVKITTETEILYGDGFESDERFDKWTLKKPKGSFIINEDTEDDSDE